MVEKFFALLENFLEYIVGGAIIFFLAVILPFRYFEIPEKNYIDVIVVFAAFVLLSTGVVIDNLTNIVIVKIFKYHQEEYVELYNEIMIKDNRNIVAKVNKFEFSKRLLRMTMAGAFIGFIVSTYYTKNSNTGLFLLIVFLMSILGFINVTDSYNSYLRISTTQPNKRNANEK